MGPASLYDQLLRLAMTTFDLLLPLQRLKLYDLNYDTQSFFCVQLLFLVGIAASVLNVTVSTAIVTPTITNSRSVLLLVLLLLLALTVAFF